MDTQEKLDILSRDAQYDLSCACGTKNPLEHRKRKGSGDGWLYPLSTASGGAGIILKTLMGNRCANDCKYCPLRAQNDFKPTALSPEEMAKFFYLFQLRRSMLGLFLSSAVMGDADKTMQMLVDTAKILRTTYQYKGYIHLKIIPGASQASIESALKYASGVSLNIETPGACHFQKLTAKKNYMEDIIVPLKFLAQNTGKGTKHPRTKLTSQFIVGASDENDSEIVRYCDAMYSNLHMERLYFSAYQKGLGDPGIPGEMQRPVIETQNGELFASDMSGRASLLREHRLYQTDFLLRKYHFSGNEILFDASGNLPLGKDPKLVWAEAHPEYYPVSARMGTLDQLLRVPGIGPELAKRVVKARSVMTFRTLEEIPIPDYARKRSIGYLVV